MTEAKVPGTLNGADLLALQYESLPPRTRLEVREDADGVTVVFRQVPFAKVVAWTLAIAAAVPLLIVLAAACVLAFRGVSRSGLSPLQAVARLGRIPLGRWTELFWSTSGLPFGVAAFVLILGAVSRLGSAGAVAALHMARTGKIVCKSQPEFTFANWEIHARDVERLRARRRTLWVHHRDGTKHFVRGRPADLRWLAATLNRFIRQHAP